MTIGPQHRLVAAGLRALRTFIVRATKRHPQFSFLEDAWEFARGLTCPNPVVIERSAVVAIFSNGQFQEPAKIVFDKNGQLVRTRTVFDLVLRGPQDGD